MDREKLRSICDVAVKKFKEEGSLQPTLIVEGMRGGAIVGMEFPDEVDKREILFTAGRTVAHLLPTEVTLISEIWIAETAPPPGKKIHDMPDRQEAISINYYKPGAESELLIVPFSRIGGEIMLGETEGPEQISNVRPVLLFAFWAGVIEWSIGKAGEERESYEN